MQDDDAKAVIRTAGFAGGRAVSRCRQWRMKAGEGPMRQGVRQAVALTHDYAELRVTKFAKDRLRSERKFSFLADFLAVSEANKKIWKPTK